MHTERLTQRKPLSRTFCSTLNIYIYICSFNSICLLLALEWYKLSSLSLWNTLLGTNISFSPGMVESMMFHFPFGGIWVILISYSPQHRSWYLNLEASDWGVAACWTSPRRRLGPHVGSPKRAVSRWISILCWKALRHSKQSGPQKPVRSRVYNSTSRGWNIPSETHLFSGSFIWVITPFVTNRMRPTSWMCNEGELGGNARVEIWCDCFQARMWFTPLRFLMIKHDPPGN